MNARRKLLLAADVADGTGLYAAPGAILLEGSRPFRVLAAGSPQAIGEVGGDCEIVHRPDCVLIPALVNAHCHLDLSLAGPMPLAGTFADWADAVRQHRAAASSDKHIRAAVLHGAELARRGGTALIGDIAGNGSRAAVDALRDSGLGGVSFLEVFGLGDRQSPSIARMQQAVQEIPALERGVRLGLQPHAPYSCGLEIYKAAARLGCPLSTHLAESLEELEFVHSATGPIAEMLKRIGVWNESIKPSCQHPIDHLAEVLADHPIVAAHVNYVDDRHFQMILKERWPLHVAYCPRASAYFGHKHHRYRDMLAVGINVALGTDSLICLDTPDRMSVLDDMRLLHRRDGTDPITLLRMATINGAIALGFDPALVSLRSRDRTCANRLAAAGILELRIDPNDDRHPLRQALLNDHAPEWIAEPSVPSNDWISGRTAATMSP